LLQPDETITADRYQQQLTNVSDALEEKRPFIDQGRRKMILLFDARPHVAKATQDHIFAAGNFSRTRRITQTWCLPITIYSGRCSIICLIHIS